MSFLVLDNLSKHFGDFVAVQDMNLVVDKGEFISLLGPSGCGKTTTLQMIAGFTEPTAGRILIEGQDMTQIKPNQRGLGIVFQSYALFPHMTVFDNVSFGLEMRNVPREERKKRVMESLDLVHLTPFAGRFPRELSGGQRQRVALARALVIKPPVLLLDEPLSNLDAKLREDMQIELREIQRTVGTTTILVTHDQSEALSLSDRVVVMNKGYVEQIDAPYRAYENPNSTFVSNFVGKTNLLDAQVVSREGQLLTVRVGETAIDVTAPDATLEDAVKISMRPEKLHISNNDAAQITGTVHNRLFLGNHWLYQVNTPLGRLLITQPNAHSQMVEEGETVGVHWNPDEIRVLPAGGAL